MVVRKGTNKGVDSYSGFGDAFGGRWEKTELADVLRAAGITDVFVTGLATDFCVSFTAKDAVKNGKTPPCGPTRPKKVLTSMCRLQDCADRGRGTWHHARRYRGRAQAMGRGWRRNVHHRQSPWGGRQASLDYY